MRHSISNSYSKLKLAIIKQAQIQFQTHRTQKAGVVVVAIGIGPTPTLFYLFFQLLATFYFQTIPIIDIVIIK
jgi:hypothetical protein